MTLTARFPRNRARDRDLGACGFLREGFQGKGREGHRKQMVKEPSDNVVCNVWPQPDATAVRQGPAMPTAESVSHRATASPPG